MKIFWQSFVDASLNAPYLTKLASYLNEIAAPGTSVHVAGMTPPDRDFGRLSELRCAIAAIDNGLQIVAQQTVVKVVGLLAHVAHDDFAQAFFLHR